jgi:hypothetical protein
MANVFSAILAEHVAWRVALRQEGVIRYTTEEVPMSLWLEAATSALHSGDYEQFRRILPISPIPLPTCLLWEAEFAIRHCRPDAPDRLCAIRFLWLMDGHEQRSFGVTPSVQSWYHPEKLFDLWQRACTDPQYRQQRQHPKMARRRPYASKWCGSANGLFSSSCANLRRDQSANASTSPAFLASRK